MASGRPSPRFPWERPLPGETRNNRVSTTDATSDLEELRRRLIEQAELFDTPDYAAGVIDALDAVVVLLEDDHPESQG